MHDTQKVVELFSQLKAEVRANGIATPRGSSIFAKLSEEFDGYGDEKYIKLIETYNQLLKEGKI